MNECCCCALSFPIFFLSDCEPIDISLFHCKCMIFLFLFNSEKRISIIISQRFVYVKNDIEIQAKMKKITAKMASYPR